jgi:hypothetical protein
MEGYYEFLSHLWKHGKLPDDPRIERPAVMLDSASAPGITRQAIEAMQFLHVERVWGMSEGRSLLKSDALYRPQVEASSVSVVVRNIQESCRAIDWIALRIAYPFCDTRTF